MKEQIEKWAIRILYSIGILLFIVFFLSLSNNINIMIPIKTGTDSKNIVVISGNTISGSNNYQIYNYWLYKGVFVFNSSASFRSYGFDFSFSPGAPKVLECIDNQNIFMKLFYFKTLTYDDVNDKYYYFSLWLITIVLVGASLFVFIRTKSYYKIQHFLDNLNNKK